MKILRTVAMVILAAAILPAADQGLVDLVMADARVVLGADVERAKSSAFGQFILSRIATDDHGIAKMTQLTGFDPRRDIREILVASAGNTAGRDNGLVLVRGTFDVSRILGAARVDGATVQNYMGVDLISGTHGHEGAVGFLDSSLAVLGDIDNVRAAIQRSRSGARLAPTAAQKIQKMSAAHDVWGTTTIPFSELAEKMPDRDISGTMKGDVLRSIEQASGGVRFGASTVDIAAEAVARSEKDATALVDVIRFLAGMVQLNRDKKDAAGLATLLDTMVLKAEANTVKLSLSVPESELEKLVPARSLRRRAAR
jgi:hypothetical protein